MTVTIHLPKGLAGVGMSLRGIDGIISIRALPDFLDPNAHNDPEFTKWRASLTPLEWDRYIMPVIVDGREVDYAHNLLTNDGITSLLKNISFSAQASLKPFAQILSIGNGAITSVARTDTAVAGDGFGTNSRQTPGTAVYTGNQADIPTSFGSTDLVATWSNVGFFGWNYGSSSNATTTTGSGTLKTHSLFNFSKPSSAVVLDYLFVVNN